MKKTLPLLNKSKFLSSYYKNKDENVHRFALRAIRGELLESERERVKERERKREKKRERERKRDKVRERERKRDKERDSFKILFTGYLIFIVKIKREREGGRERDREIE